MMSQHKRPFLAVAHSYWSLFKGIWVWRQKEFNSVMDSSVGIINARIKPLITALGYRGFTHSTARAFAAHMTARVHFCLCFPRYLVHDVDVWARQIRWNHPWRDTMKLINEKDASQSQTENKSRLARATSIRGPQGIWQQKPAPDASWFLCG